VVSTQEGALSRPGTGGLSTVGMRARDQREGNAPGHYPGHSSVVKTGVSEGTHGCA
jgi:hypothetical protein